MKTNLLYLLLGGFMAISIAATTTDLITTKPAKPISTIAFTCSYEYGRPDEQIMKYSKMGYITKSVSSAGDHYTKQALIVMEKY